MKFHLTQATKDDFFFFFKSEWQNVIISKYSLWWGFGFEFLWQQENAALCDVIHDHLAKSHTHEL